MMPSKYGRTINMRFPSALDGIIYAIQNQDLWYKIIACFSAGRNITSVQRCLGINGSAFFFSRKHSDQHASALSTGTSTAAFFPRSPTKNNCKMKYLEESPRISDHCCLEHSALKLFMNGLLLDEDSRVLVVCDNAKSPSVSQTKRKYSNSCAKAGKTRLESRWDNPFVRKDQLQDTCWASFNDENPSCAGLTLPARTKQASVSLAIPEPLRKSTTVDESSSTWPCPAYSRLQSPVLPVPMTGKLSIPKPKIGLCGRKVTVQWSDVLTPNQHF